MNTTRWIVMLVTIAIVESIDLCKQYSIKDCTTSCPEEYMSKCNDTLHRVDVCKNSTKGCFCLPGRYGAQCDQECDEGYYGHACSSKCECPTNECDVVTGCTNSKAECEEGYYGLACSMKCECPNNECNEITGCLKGGLNHAQLVIIVVAVVGLLLLGLFVCIVTIKRKYSKDSLSGLQTQRHSSQTHLVSNDERGWSRRNSYVDSRNLNQLTVPQTSSEYNYIDVDLDVENGSHSANQIQGTHLSTISTGQLTVNVLNTSSQSENSYTYIDIDLQSPVNIGTTITGIENRYNYIDIDPNDDGGNKHSFCNEIDRTFKGSSQHVSGTYNKALVYNRAFEVNKVDPIRHCRTEGEGYMTSAHRRETKFVSDYDHVVQNDKVYNHLKFSGQ